jgi:formylmethanofuran dehydrogenase subunit D
MDNELNLVTFQDIFQDEAKKKGKYSDEFQTASALILLDKLDMASLGAKDGQMVLVENEAGRIVVSAKTSDDDPHSGLAFMIRSPWSNQLIGDDVCDIKSLGFKKISVRVSPTEENVTQVTEILERMRN